MYFESSIYAVLRMRAGLVSTEDFTDEMAILLAIARAARLYRVEHPDYDDEL